MNGSGYGRDVAKAERQKRPNRTWKRKLLSKIYLCLFLVVWFGLMWITYFSV